MGFALYAAFGGYLSHTVQGRWDVLVSKSLLTKFNLSSILEIHTMEGENRLSSIVLWYPQVCHVLCVCICACVPVYAVKSWEILFIQQANQEQE